jgi:hypothetical protein
VAAARDELLLAVGDEVVSLASELRLGEVEVRPGARLGQGERGDVPAFGDRSEVAVFLVGGRLGGDDGAPHAVHPEAEGGGRAGLADGLGQHGEGEQALLLPTEPSRDVKAHEVGVGEGPEPMLWPGAFRVDGLRARSDRRADNGLDHGAELANLGCEKVFHRMTLYGCAAPSSTDRGGYLCRPRIKRSTALALAARTVVPLRQTLQGAGLAPRRRRALVQSRMPAARTIVLQSDFFGDPFWRRRSSPRARPSYGRARHRMADGPGDAGRRGRNLLTALDFREPFASYPTRRHAQNNAPSIRDPARRVRARLRCGDPDPRGRPLVGRQRTSTGRGPRRPQSS